MSVVSDSTVCISSRIDDKEKGADSNFADAAAVSTIASPHDSHYESPKGLKKLLIVTCLCAAQFFDIFIGCAAIVALPTVRSLPSCSLTFS